LNSYGNPVPKRTCEQISADVQFESKYYKDACDVVTEDTVYELFKRDGQPLDVLQDVVNRGDVSKFR
jgi:hypothetical protein